MRSPEPTDSLKAQMLDGAVADNLDAIHGRPPQRWRPWRPIRQHVQIRAARTGWTAPVVVVIIVIVLAVAGIARRPASAPVTSVGPATPALAPAASPAAAMAGPDAAVLTQQIRPGVLALGVRRVILDAGHGGDNLGTAGAGGLQEKDLTLDIAERVRKLMVTRGFDAVMTRTVDDTLSLQQRASVANSRKGDIFVSIHLNWLRSSSAAGVETYYLGPSDGPEPDAVAAAENQHSGYSLSDMRSLLERIYTDARREESRRLAESVQRALVEAVRKTDPSIANRGVKAAPFVVLVATEMPAILAEVSCLSNRGEEERLRSVAYRNTLAEALAAGIQAFAHEQRGSEAERTGSSGS